jgi:FkbM family methyltransferase
MSVIVSQGTPPTPSQWSLQLAKARSVNDLLANMANYNGGLAPGHLTTIAILGTAPEGQRLLGICHERGIKIAALVDDDPEKLGKAILGTTVESSSRLDNLDRAIPIIIASHRVLDATRRLRAKGFKTVLPFAVLQVLSPDVFKPHMFYAGWLEDLLNNRQQYEWLESTLADERSRQVLSAVIQYRLTGDPMFLDPVMDTGRYHQGLYHPAGLFECSDNEVYVDAGAYDGDSLNWFKDRVSDRYDRILAFEPDPRTYARLAKNFANEKRIEAINAGLHRKKAVLQFRNDASRGAIISDDGNASIDVVSLDDYLDGKRASFIKMNIEGAEVDALYGAQKTIQRWLPKLAISIYHRPSDLWHIPQIVHEFSANYDLFIRQHDGGVIETVLYAIPRTN